MNAILAIFDGSGRAIIVINREGVEIIYFLLYFIDSTITLRRRPRPTPSEEDFGGGVSLPIKTMPLEGKMALSWWGFLCPCV